MVKKNLEIKRERRAEIAKEFSIGKDNRPVTPELIAAVRSNVSQIRDIPPEHHPEIVQIFLDPDLRGNMSVLVPFFQQYEAIDELRATALAMWQFRMLMRAQKIIDFKNLGLTKFEWLVTNPHYCPDHERLNGRVFLLSDPPIIDSATGEYGFPGDLLECRCRMTGVIEFGDTNSAEDAFSAGDDRPLCVPHEAPKEAPANPPRSWLRRIKEFIFR